MPKQRITLAVGALGLAALVTVAGCGASGTAKPLGNISLSAAEAVQQTAQKAEQVTSYTADMVVDGSTRQGPVKVQGRMVYQNKPDLAANITVDTMNVGARNVPGGMRAILLGDTAYVKVDALNTLLGATKPWIKVSASQVDGGHKADVDNLLTKAREFDLANATKLVGSSKDVKAVGTESVGGVDTTHYSGTFPVKEAVQALDPQMRDKLGNDLPDATDLKFDMWADAQSLPRKIVLSGVEKNENFTATVMFSGFNEKTDIAAPPADQVGELPKAVNGTGN